MDDYESIARAHARIFAIPVQDLEESILTTAPNYEYEELTEQEILDLLAAFCQQYY